MAGTLHLQDAPWSQDNPTRDGYACQESPCLSNVLLIASDEIIDHAEFHSASSISIWTPNGTTTRSVKELTTSDITPVFDESNPPEVPPEEPVPLPQPMPEAPVVKPPTDGVPEDVWVDPPAPEVIVESEETVETPQE